MPGAGGSHCGAACAGWSAGFCAALAQQAHASLLTQGSSHAGVGEGDVVWWRASGSGGGQQPGTVQYGLVTGLHQGKRSVAAWHLQLLSTSLALPECSCPILSE